MKIGIISDTHSYIDERICEHLQNCDEIWHAGDIGSLEVTDNLESIAEVRAVYGNIDGGDIRQTFPENQVFECEGKKVWMTHIGSFPPNYNKTIKIQLNRIRPDIFVCGHSHILRVISDPNRRLLHINPGAAGKHGFHKMRTLVRFDIENGKIDNMEVVELGKRGAVENEEL
ncbi:MAG: putative phosphoesterase [Arenicella sp.]|jgi:putative phosphoesterase